MKKKKFLRILSSVMAILIIFQTAPIGVVAKDSHTHELVSSEPVEITSKRNEYEKHYRSPDGKYYAEIYSQPVHYKDNGEWKEIDLTLTSTKEKSGFATESSATPVFLPNSLSNDNQITVTSGTYTVGFGINAYGNGNRSAAEKTSTDGIKYTDILPSTDIEYIPLTNGVKENIIVKKASSAYRYTFEINTDGLISVPQSDGSVYLMKSEDDTEPAFVLAAPFMYDAEGAQSEAVTMTLSNGFLTVEADADWINSDDRVFPVIIDPYCYVPSQSSFIKTGKVSNLAKNRTYVGDIATGRNGIYSERTFFDLRFPDVPENCTFYKAELILNQLAMMNVNSITDYLRLYDLSDCDYWDYSSVTWNTQPVPQSFNSYTSLPYLDSFRLSSSNETTYAFDVTSAAEAYYGGEYTNGYLLAFSNEANYVYASFSSVGSSSNSPQLRVYYIQPCQCCGDKCVFDTTNGESCPCTCPSWEECDCLYCGTYCGCGKLNCDYGAGCECECESEAECDCVACNSYTTTTKDANGNITSYTVSDGTKVMTETYNYSGTGNSMSSMVDSNGITTSYTYTADGKNITSLTNGNSVVNYTYSGDNLTSVSQNVSGLTNSTGITNSYTYNSDNQVTSISHNDFSYNFTYDENSNNTAVSVGNQPLATYSYDTEGNITSMTYGNGFIITYTYDTDGNLSLIQYTSPDDNTTTDAFEFYYNDDGTLATTVDYCSDTTTEFYEDGYYVYKNETGEEIQSVYCDEDGNITDSGIFGTVYTEYLEDEFNFQTGETVYSENISTDTSEMTRNAVYDYFGRKISSLTENTNWDTEDTVTVEESIGYNDTQTTAGSRPTSYVSTVTSGDTEESLSFRYVYDNRGNITEIYDTSAVTEALYAKYAYDEAGQLIREDCAALNKTVTYSYDKGGNLVTKMEYPFTTGTLGAATDTVSYTYDSVWKDKLVSFNGKAITYDAIGNPLSFDGQSFTWSGRELWKYESSDSEIEFRYNEYGLRTLKRIYEGTNVHNYYYFWSDDDRLLGYTVDLGESEEADTQVILIYDESNEPIGFTVAGFDFFYVKNIQGDVLKIVNPSGQTVVSFTYDAWGNFTLTPNSESDRTEITFAAAFNPIFYRGYLFDYETGLYYLQSRYYNPEMGRFVNSDSDKCCNPEYNLVASNLYTYCLNRPTRFTDTTGNGTISELLALSHLSYNSKINVGDSYINGQAVGNVAKMKYGIARISYNGCELIAIYNALLKLGKKDTLAHIIFEFEMNSGSWMDGLLGTKPTSIGPYIRSKGLKTDTYYKPSSMDKKFSVGNTGIVCYRHTVVMIHTVMITKLSTDKIIVYNPYNDSTDTKDYNSISHLISTNRRSMISGWIIKKK